MGLNFRKINKNDFPTCAEILVAAYSGAPWHNNWTIGDAQLRIEATMSGFNSRGYIIEKDNKVIAMCLGRIDYYYNNWSQFCIDEFNVIPNLQGQGIGKKLLQFTSDELREDGINRVFLITGGKQASEFYKKNKFKNSNDGIMMAYEL